MNPTLPIKPATLWRDHTHKPPSGRIWTVTEATYTVVFLAVGIVLGLAVPFAQRTVAHTLAGLIRLTHSKDKDVQEGESRDDISLMAGHENSQGQPSSRGQGRSCCNRAWRSANLPKLISAITVTSGVCFTVLSTFVSKPSTGDAVLSGATTCGAWGLAEDANGVAQDEDALLQGDKEALAGQYARNCYGSLSSMGVSECLLFTKPFVASSIMTEQRCPFANQTYCPGNGFEAVKFSTGLVEAKAIGLNIDKGPLLNRTTICVPLDLDAGFAKMPKDHQIGDRWNYDLGPVGSESHKSGYTFQQYSDPFKSDARSYTMSTVVHMYAKNSSQNYWLPDKALDIHAQLNDKSTPFSLTLMFINSCRLFYKESSDDPIFPAQARYFDSGLYYNDDPRARPLACIDWIEVCANETSCSPPYQSHSNEDKYHAFMRYALNKSTAYDAIFSRGAVGLDAQSKIRGDTSLPLSENPSQWITEGWNFFNTSLARIQYDALDIAKGANSDKRNKGYVWKMPSRFTERDMCGIFLYQIPKGYSNIRLWKPLLVGFALPVFFFFVGWQTKEEFSPGWKKSGLLGDDNHILIEKLYCMLLGRTPDPEASEAAAQGPELDTASRAGGYGTTASVQVDDSGEHPRSPMLSAARPHQRPPSAQSSSSSRPSRDITDLASLVGSSSSTASRSEARQPQPATLNGSASESAPVSDQDTPAAPESGSAATR